MELHMVHKSLDNKEFLVLGFFFIVPGKSERKPLKPHLIHLFH